MQERFNSQDMADPENIKPRKHSPEKKPPKKITEKYLYNSGLAYLQRFPSSTPHFKRIMGRKIDRSCNYHKDQNRDDCTKLLDQTVETFVRQGLLNDSAYLQGMINSLRRRGLSRQAILARLQQKGMAQDTILKTLRDYDAEKTGDADLTAALQLARRKKLGPFRRDSETDKNKELAALARAGFSFDVAQKVLGMETDEAEEVLSSL